MSAPYVFDPTQSPNIGYVIPSSPSRNLRTFLEYINALSQIPCDLDRIFNCFDDRLEHRILPASLERPVLTKPQYREYLKNVLPLFSSFQITLHEVVETANVLTVHASSRGQSVSGMPYTNEYMIVAHFVPAPPPPHPYMPPALPKMRYVKEFVDSAFSLRFFAEERQRERDRQAAENARREQQEGQGQGRGWAPATRGRPSGGR